MGQHNLVEQQAQLAVREAQARPKFRVEDLSAWFGDKQVLRGIDLDAQGIEKWAREMVDGERRRGIPALETA